ncbi:hypothetical protein Tco_0299366 [Tanacetum coccineum]
MVMVQSGGGTYLPKNNVMPSTGLCASSPSISFYLLSSFTRALKSLIISLHLVAIDRGGGECGGGCEDKSVCAWGDKILSAFMMACVAPRSHGGDAGGSPPRRPVPAQCQSSMLRIETGNRSLRKAFRENNEQSLKIGFDYEE